MVPGAYQGHGLTVQVQRAGYKAWAQLPRPPLVYHLLPRLRSVPAGDAVEQIQHGIDPERGLAAAVVTGNQCRATLKITLGKLNSLKVLYSEPRNDDHAKD